MSWHSEAACSGYAVAGHALWWSTKKHERAQAIKICERCPVADECLAEGIAFGDEIIIRGGVRL